MTTALNDADVPGYVTPAFGIGKAELSKPPRKMLPRVIGHDEKRRCAVFVVYRERRRLVSRQKTIRRLIHLRPASLTEPNGPQTSFRRSTRRSPPKGAELYRGICQECHLPPVSSKEFWDSRRW